MFRVKVRKLTAIKWQEKFPAGCEVIARRWDDNGVDIQIMSPVDHLWYSGRDICRSQSNTCSFGDIMIRIESPVKMTLQEKIDNAKANIIRNQELLDMGCDYKHYSTLLAIHVENLKEYEDEYNRSIR